MFTGSAASIPQKGSADRFWQTLCCVIDQRLDMMNLAMQKVSFDAADAG